MEPQVLVQGSHVGAGLLALSPWVLPAMFNRASLRRLHKGAGVAGTNGYTLWLKMTGMCSGGWASGCQGGHAPLNLGENCFLPSFSLLAS